MAISFKYPILGAIFVGFSLTTGCSTLGTVADKVNPFDGKDAKDIAADPDRISILSLEDKLSVDGKIAPADVVLPPAYTNSEWPQTGGYPTHNVQRTDATGSLKKLWSKDIGKGSSRKGRLTAPPVIAGGRIFSLDADNRITAMDAETGAEFWDYKITVKSKGKSRKGHRTMIDHIKDPFTFQDSGGTDKESVGGGLAVADGRVFASSGYGLIAAFDAVSGEKIWETPTRTPVNTAPAVDNGRLFAVTDDNELFALNADTGEVLWTYQAIIETARMLTVPSPAILDDVVIAPFSSGEIVTLRVQNGGVLWQDGLAGTGMLTPLASLNDIASGPVIADGYVFASAQSGSLAAFDLRTGQRVWQKPAGSLNFPLVIGDYIYTVTTEGEAACISKADGTIVWITQLQAFKNEKKRKDRISWMGPVSTGDELVFMSSRGKAVELNILTGEILRDFKLSGNVFVPPVIANNIVYYVTDDAKLVALR